MSTWGFDLWDQRDVIEKHTHNGIEFLDNCARFMKERIRVEQEYAKSMRKLVKQYQFKKKEEEDLPYTYQHAFKKLLQETDDFAGQREVISEEVHNQILKEMQKLSSESKLERRKALQTLSEHKNHLEQLHKALQVAKNKYDKASEDAHTGLKVYETATKALDITKAQLLKYQKTSQDKGHVADKAKEDYKLALDSFNKTQTLYYQADLPDTINKGLQSPEESRINKLAGFFCQFAQIQQKVNPIVLKCFEGMVAAGESCGPNKDSLTLIDRHKTGESPPGSVQLEEWGKPSNSLAAPSPVSKLKPRVTKPKNFGMSNKKKEQLNNETIANDYSDLPPAQRKKKFNKTIASLEDQANQLEKQRAGMLKIADTSKQFGGDMASIQGQIDANEKDAERVRSLLHQYKCYLEAMDGDSGRKSSRPTSNADFPPPPIEKPDGLQAPQSPEYPNDEFDDELRCSVLYDFSGNNEGEMSVYAGEELAIVEDDDGSGWTRVLRGDEEGYIPTSYVQKI